MIGNARLAEHHEPRAGTPGLRVADVEGLVRNEQRPLVAPVVLVGGATGTIGGRVRRVVQAGSLGRGVRGLALVRIDAPPADGVDRTAVLGGKRDENRRAE